MDSSNQDYLQSLIDSIRKLDYINPDEIPNIDLYMDQVTTFMDEHLKSSKRFSEDKLLTKTMINNYTKNELLPPPNKKKYSKEHILLLIFIYYFKNILTISDIQHIFNPLTEKYYGKGSDIGLEAIYKEVFSYERDQMDNLLKDVIRKYNKSRETFSNVESEEEKEFLNTFSFICMLSFDVYVKKQMIEKLIDESILEKPKKDKKKD
ncbi:DUF1836 domain-containing protein [Anaerocolumna sp. AGMB13025]|uniref:DUF1836 domain-containing protein n=1 Tax=Anaerocolumna sp. AGMB13025 TaxID=3039116 RepID=UPI00241E2785|nr:DUF1836 domain-containing protein [Anaerocolumna sp. AGMB13025]WFR55908.1 DUF1836 domain-containing protein [Anaerocolumna sp. AGMB13025]